MQASAINYTNRCNRSWLVTDLFFTAREPWFLHISHLASLAPGFSFFIAFPWLLGLLVVKRGTLFFFFSFVVERIMTPWLSISEILPLIDKVSNEWYHSGNVSAFQPLDAATGTSGYRRRWRRADYEDDNLLKTWNRQTFEERRDQLRIIQDFLWWLGVSGAVPRRPYGQSKKESSTDG